MDELHRCVFCGSPTRSALTVKSSPKETADEYYCCSEGCAGGAGRYFRFSRYGSVALFVLVGISILLILAVALGISKDIRIPIGGMSLLGAALLLLPVPTERTIDRWGIRKSVRGVRIIGGIVLAAAAVIFFL